LLFRRAWSLEYYPPASPLLTRVRFSKNPSVKETVPALLNQWHPLRATVISAEFSDFRPRIVVSNPNGERSRQEFLTPVQIEVFHLYSQNNNFSFWSPRSGLCGGHRGSLLFSFSESQRAPEQPPHGSWRVPRKKP